MEVQDFLRITKLKFMKLKLVGNYGGQYLIIVYGYLGREHRILRGPVFISINYHVTISD